MKLLLILLLTATITSSNNVEKEMRSIFNQQEYALIQTSDKDFKKIEISGKSVGYLFDAKIVSIPKSMERYNLIIIYSNDLSIRRIAIYDLESHYGQRIASQKWLAQFVGYNGKRAPKPGKDIDALSGATYSTNSFCEVVYKTTTRLKNLAASSN
ncbi:MAG: FMN-binding protein [Bacteroidales bacterium]|jgi:hypothetical protein